LCFGRHVKPLVPAAFAVVSTHSSFDVRVEVRQAAGRKNNVVPTSLSGITVGIRKAIGS
jgi:hypothetical protein